MIPDLLQATDRAGLRNKMKKVAICFTSYGKALTEKLNREAVSKGIEPVTPYISMEGAPDDPGFIKVTESLEEWTASRFREHAAIIFVGAVGIAVRAIAPSVRDKLSDSPVIVIDDMGRHVIPLLSGHVGGADKMAVTIASLICAEPVITTSTDLHDAFSADVFARENGLKIMNRDGIKKVSAKAIEGKKITLSIKDYPPKEPVDIIVADETDREYDLLLSPRRYVIGIGMKKDTEPDKAEEYILNVLKDNDISVDDVYAVSTIDIKEDEPAIKHICDKYRLPLISFDAGLLAKAEGEFASSEFVRDTVGVDNVCERAAVLAAGPGAELTVRKVAGSGITVAAARRMNG